MLVGMVCSFAGYAYQITLEGKADGKYAIIVEIDRNTNGSFSGRYAYKSTINRQGRNNPATWLYIMPDYYSTTDYTITDSKGAVQEEWSNAHLSQSGNSYSLSASVINSRGKTFDIQAGSSNSGSNSQSLTSLFKKNLGNYASDFNMFSNPQIVARLKNLMGAQNFNIMKGIYQTEHPIEYQNGMFYANAFVAHQCCDPATVWAYDSHNNKFYVYIIKDGREYWWSETGNTEFKFHELVENTF